mgnify:CR=1 FL=1|jgi:hypothetical protein
MKKKIVLWGADKDDNKLLIALELIAEENKVNLYSFPEEVATEDLYNQLMNIWREGNELAFPDNHKLMERPLSVTEDLLPEDIKVERTDLISRAQAEWHFVVLSSKLHDLYKSELEEFRERIAKLEEYESGIFEEMKGFWSKVSEQAREKNLFREHANALKDETNKLFDKLKELRAQANAKFRQISKERVAAFSEEVEQLEAKIEKGLGLKPIFEELKQVQERFKAERFTKEDRNKLWNKIDGAFKKFKLKKYGERPDDSNNKSSRLERRYQGLLSAIDKMNKSIARDLKDINFQNRRVNETQGQLEMQIRQAKVKMVQERIDSKEEKLKDMMKTKLELEQKLQKEKERQQKQEEQKKIREKEKALKEQIAAEITKKSDETQTEAEKLEEAAKALNKTAGKSQGKAKADDKDVSDKSEGSEQQDSDKKGESFFSKLKFEISEIVEDAVDTVKAVSEVVEDRIEAKAEEMHLEEKIDKMKDKAEQLIEDVEYKLEDVKEKILGEEE